MYTDTSFIHRWRLFIGYRFVEENTLLPVMQNGRVVTFREPGYHYRSGLGQSYGDPISTALRIPPTVQVDVSTTDCLIVSVFINVKYVFDPRRCAPKMWSGIVTLSDDSLNNLVYDHVGRAARTVCGAKTEEELANGALWPQLELGIHRRLQNHLSAYGILISGDTAVTILTIAPPPEIIRERVAARQRAIYADSIQQQPPEMAHDLHEQEIVRHGDFVHVSLDHTPPPRTNGLPMMAVPEFGRNGRHKHPN
ncbi:MAG TPA: SPFH domain-containing protein [Chloroflexota bacterium]|nr:SPFH domain-containing protein [Chloroflexota bacterium]HUM70471.1 SPFH domain-containing protein [Chloroflexota bacterium]